MSLLLDALKRSEKARQEKAAQGGAADGLAETHEFSLEALEEEAREERARVAETAERSSVRMPSDTPPVPTLRRKPTDDTVEGFPDLEILEPDPSDTTLHEAPPEQVDDAGGGAPRPTFSLLDDTGEQDDPRAMADTAGTLPDASEVRRTTTEYFDGTQSVGVSPRAVRKALEEGDTDGSGERVAATGAQATSTTQRRARTVVEARTAGSRARSGSGAWLWIVLLLVVGGAIGGGAWYYVTELSRGPALLAGGAPPPRPAPAPSPQPLPAPDPLPAETAPAALPDPAEIADSLGEAPVRGDLALAEEPQPEQPPPAIEMPVPPVDEVLTEPEPPSPARAAEEVEPADLAGRLAKAIRDANLPGQGASSGIRIARSTRSDPVAPLLTRAYEAFQRGDEGAARQAWQQVLANEPRNRDALLGMAALHTRAGQPQQAGELYLRVLESNPRDRLAQGALIALSGQLDPVEAETRVKLLLDGDPQAHFLHFVLGNLYAAEARWPLAQEAYFKAFRLDEGNPDYVFNLAVSLDHLAQQRAALGFYQRALQLADSRSTGFDTGAVMNRIRMMTAASTGQ